MSSAPVALIGPFGLCPGAVATVERHGWLDEITPRLRLRAHVTLGGGVDVEIDGPIAKLFDLTPEGLADKSELGRGLMTLRRMATIAKGPLGCIPKTRRIIRAQFGLEEQRMGGREALMTRGALDPLDLALSPASPAVAEFRARVEQLEAVDGGIFIDRLIAETKVRPTDEVYGLVRGAADLLVATILTRTRGEDAQFFGTHTLNDLIREIDGALTLLVGTISREPTFLALERSLRCLHYARQHRPIVVLEADRAALDADPVALIEAAAGADAAAIGVLVDLAAGEPIAERLARAARASGLPIAIGLPEAQCRDPATLLAHTPPEGATWCAQHVALCMPYGPDSLPVTAFDHREPEHAHGGYRVRASTAFVAAVRLAGDELEAPLRDELTLAYQYLDACDRAVWSEPVVGPSGDAADALRARGYLVLPFESFDAEGRIQIVDPRTIGLDRTFLDRVLRESAALDEEDLRRLYPIYFTNLVGRDRERRARAAAEIATLARRDPMRAGALRASRWLIELAPLATPGCYFGGLGLFRVAADARFASGVHRALAAELDLERELRRWDAGPLRELGDATLKVLFDAGATAEWTASTGLALGAIAHTAEHALDGL